MNGSTQSAGLGGKGGGLGVERIFQTCNCNMVMQTTTGTGADENGLLLRPLLRPMSLVPRCKV